MSVDEREAKEADEFRTGPLSVLTTSVKTNSQVCVCVFVCVERAAA
jgi:small nuclear ribonucleoprotein D2